MTYAASAAREARIPACNAILTLALCTTLLACASGGVRGKSGWDSVRYQDNDASYVPPVTSCVDDSPGC